MIAHERATRPWGSAQFATTAVPAGDAVVVGAVVAGSVVVGSVVVGSVVDEVIVTLVEPPPTSTTASTPTETRAATDTTGTNHRGRRPVEDPFVFAALGSKSSDRTGTRTRLVESDGSSDSVDSGFEPRRWPVQLGDSTADAEFRAEIRAWMNDHLTGEFAQLRFRGGPGDEHMFVQERMDWERHMAAHGWTCVGWPVEHGGRGLPISQEVIFHEEYARAGGPGRAGLIGEGLLGPTIIHFASPEQQKAILPGFASAANPVDISGQTSKDGTSVSNNALRLVLADPNIDMVVIRSKQSTNTREQMDEYMDIVRKTPKPVMIAFGPDRDDEAKKVFDENEIPWHVTPPRAARAAAALHEFSKRRRAYLAANKNEPRPIAKQDLKWPAGEATLSEHAAKAILKAYGIPVVGEALMTLDEVRALKAAPFPFPLAVKINSADIPHKTEAGGVKLGISSVEELKAAAEAVTKNALAYKPGAKLEGVLVQQMASGLEVIVGGLNDACFGPTVVFGLGGIFAEVLKDVTYRFAPFGMEAAREMVQEIKGAIVMNGYRGKEKLDIEGLAQVLSRVSWLLHDHRDRIAEMDINPLFMTPKSITAADALITLKP